jgi:AAA15 family ATPase/GTPase
MPSQQENASYFSELSIQQEEKGIIDAMHKEFTAIEDISVQVSAGIPTIYVTVPYLAEKIPINFLSSGITKLLALLLGVAHQHGGVVLIDEIENGFYYDRLSSVWALLLEFCKKYNVQVFASTHSRECLEAAAKCAADNEDEFSLIRTEKLNGTTAIKQFSGTAFRAAISQYTEVR